MESVGAYEAKTHLPRLLEKVAAGESITITRHGHAIARLVPVDDDERDPHDVVAALRAARQGVTLGDLTIRDMIADGRRA